MAVDWRLGLVGLAALVLLLAVSATGMVLANKNNAALAAHTSVLNTAILTYLQGIKIIRGYLRHDSGYDQARAAVIKGAELNDRTLHSPVRWLVGVMTVATGFAVALLVPVAGHGFVDGRTGLDTLALFLVVALGYLTPVIGLVGVLATVLVRIQFSATAVREMLAEEELPLPARPQAPERFDVALEDVEFAYEAGREVLHGVSLDVPEGTTCALVGATGSGKTTIARLIAAIGGVDVREIEPALLARLVASVQQDEYVFATTLLENIRIARPGATDAEVIAAGEAAQLGELVAGLPDGWASALGAGAATSPAASGSGSPSPGPCSRTRPSSSSTRPPPPWTRSPNAGRSRPSGRSPGAVRSSPSPTAWTPSAPPTGSPSSRRAAPGPPAATTSCWPPTPATRSCGPPTARRRAGT